MYHSKIFSGSQIATVPEVLEHYYNLRKYMDIIFLFADKKHSLLHATKRWG